MNQLKIFALALPFAFSALAFAEGGAASGSQYQHQTSAGKFELTPSIMYGTIKTTYNSANSVGGASSATDDISNNIFHVEYGIDAMWSFGLNIGYEVDKVTYSPASAHVDTRGHGMMDPDVFLNGQYDLGPGSLRFGTHLGFSFGDHTVNSAGDTNEASGALSVTPFVGYEMMAGPGTLGARVTYDIYQGDRSWKDDSQTVTSSKLKGGETLTATAFYEMDLAPIVWGIDLGIANHAATKFVNNGTTTDQKNSFSNMKVETYIAWEAMPDFTLLPTLGFGSPTNLYNSIDASGISNSTGIYGSLALRLGF